jgi:hypothetical protein
VDLRALRGGSGTGYETPGEGDSKLDFGFANAGREWRVELMRLEETEAARWATVFSLIENGIRWISRMLRTNAEDRTRCLQRR